MASATARTRPTLGVSRDEGASGGGAGPVRAVASQRAKRELGKLGALTWPDQPTAGAVAAVVDVLVDHLPGGTEQVHEFGREEVRWTRGGAVHVRSLLLAVPGTPHWRRRRSLVIHPGAPGRPGLRR